jgi:hypothetical protein
MLRTIEQQKLVDLKLAEERKKRNAQMLSEVEVSNKVALDRKADKLRAERDEDLKIVRYNADRIAKEEQRAAEERRMKEEKELEIQRLRELQERAADRQGEIDALRAKRAFEEGERKARREEKEKAELARVQSIDLDRARRRQFVEREVMLAQQAKAERDEFLRVIQKQKEQESEERSIEQQKHSAFRSHAQTIR